MPVSVTMPRLGESVTEGTVTRWLKQEGDQVTADEPLLEVSTDKVDTEVPSPASGVLSSIKVAEDETVEIGVELAVISEEGESTDSGAGAGAGDSGAGDSGAGDSGAADSGAGDSGAADSGGDGGRAEVAPQPDPQADAQAQPEQQAQQQQPAAQAEPEQDEQRDQGERPAQDGQQTQPQQAPQQQEQQPAQAQQFQQSQQSQQQPAQSQQAPPAPAAPAAAPPTQAPPAPTRPAAAPAPAAHASADDDEVAGTYVTPLVRKLASEHSIDLNSLTGTGVGGRIRKSDVLAAADAAAQARAEAEAAAAKPAVPAAPAAATGQPAASAPTGPGSSALQAAELRGQTVKLSRLRQVIASRMVESLRVSAQLTTVVEVDVTRIARLREAAKADFERREGVKLSFLPFFAIVTVEALREHPNVNCSVDTEAGTVTYHDAEHLGIAVDTERGLLVPVIHSAGDLNLGGIARKIADLAERTRTNKVSPDELGGGTFTLTNTGSRGALFDTPIINQPQVGILGTGSVVKRPVVISDPNLGETIAVRSMVYLALSYDHRIVDGADAARFLTTMKSRLEAGDFERDLGLS
jgi:pyruvate dehydrogenase E2 component (dihydrolipoamide acetyltransferase)